MEIKATEYDVVRYCLYVAAFESHPSAYEWELDGGIVYKRGGAT